VVGDHDPFAGTEVLGVGAGLGHLAHDLVAENGRTGRRRAQLGQIRAAQAAAQDPQQELARPDPGRGTGLEADLADTGVDGRPHGASWPCR
jgi:hypothetical protein